MNPKRTLVLCGALLAAGLAGGSRANEPDVQFPKDATFTTLILTPLAIEGLTGDSAGNLYTTGRSASSCEVWKISLANPSLVTVGFLPPGCNASGIAFDEAGDLYVADAAGAGTIWKLTPSESSPPNAIAFATGVPGTNGIAFDRDGNLWTGDGTTGEGRVWKCIPNAAGDAATCSVMFRIQPMANVVNVGRDARTLPPGTINAQRQATNTLGSQPLVANGVAFNRDGDLFVADTARGALWKIEFDDSGAIKNQMECDETFGEKTLCLDSVFVAHPYLEGTDGIALDRAGNIWNAANERNAIVVVTKRGRVIEVFRNPVNEDTGLRNDAKTDTDPTANTRILEFPTSPFLLRNRLCVAQSDGNRRDNSPNTAGEITPAGPDRGKISCMDQELERPGLPLPVR